MFGFWRFFCVLFHYVCLSSFCLCGMYVMVSSVWVLLVCCCSVFCSTTNVLFVFVCDMLMMFDVHCLCMFVFCLLYSCCCCFVFAGVDVIVWFSSRFVCALCLCVFHLFVADDCILRLCFALCSVCLLVCVRGLSVMFVFLLFDVVFVLCLMLLFVCFRFVCVARLCVFLLFGCCWRIAVLFLFHYMCVAYCLFLLFLRVFVDT